MESAIGARRVALFSSLYAGALAGALGLLALFLLGWDVVAYALGADPRDPLGQIASGMAFSFFDSLAILGGILGSYWAVHYDFSRGAQTLPKALLVAINLLAIPGALLANAAGPYVEDWFTFLAGAVVASINVVAFLFSQYTMGEHVLIQGLRYAGTFSLLVISGAWLERLALLPDVTPWARLAGHVLLLGAAVAVAFYALLLANEVWERAADDAAIEA